MATTQTRRRAPKRKEEDARLMSATAARNRFAEVTNRIAYGGERIIVGRRGQLKDAIAMIPVSDLRLLEELEDRLDVAAAVKAMNEETVSWEQLKERLGI